MNEKFRHLTIFDDDGKVDQQDIEGFEKKHGICFPKTYKDLTLAYNGAYFQESDFDFINKSGEEDGRAFSFYSFGEDKEENGENIEFYNRGLQDPQYYGIGGLIGIGSTAEGDTLCFDYRDNPKTCEPKVILLVHDEYEEESDGTVYMKVEPIANNFDTFLDMLYEYKDDEE